MRDQRSEVTDDVSPPGRWIEVADGVLVRRYDELDLSLGLVVGRTRCLVIDTGGDKGQGIEFATAVREVTALPWSVAFTHSHFDHSFGAEAFVPCDVWAHERCSADLRASWEEDRDNWVQRYRDRGEYAVADRIEAVRIVLPERLVGDRAELDLGGRRVELVHFGPAHSDNDLVIHVPDVGAMFVGDLVDSGGPPHLGAAYPQSWPSALDGILSLSAPKVLPGHGDPADSALVRAQRADLARIADLCRAVTAGTLTTDQALRYSPFPERDTLAALRRSAC